MNRAGVRLSSLRWLCMALIFLVMSCEDDGDGDGCLGDTDALIVGCKSGCGTGMTPIGDGCMGSCLFGGDGDGCGTCAGDGCDMDCGDCGDCGDYEDYAYTGGVVEGAVQIHVTSSLFEFVEDQLVDLIEVAAADILDFDSYCQRCADGDESYDCDACDRWFGHCLEPISESGVSVCNRGRNCNVGGDPEGEHDGCWAHLKLGDPELNTDQRASNHGRAEVYLPIEDVNASLPSSVLGNCTLHLGKHGDREFSARVGVELIRNPFDGNTEVYIGKPSVARDGLNIGGDCFLLNVAGAFGIIDSVIDGIVDGIGAISCRGCDSDADCGGGNTSCQNGTCRDDSGRMCQGIQLGADVKLDAGALLQSIDPGAEAQLGVRAFLGSYVETFNNGLQLAARLGGDPDPQSLCVPMRPSPAKSNDSCRDGKVCPSLEALNDTNLVYNPSTESDEEFHIGAGISMSGLNQVLWSAYSSGLLCLSISGEADGLDMLSTSLVSLFVKSLGNLTYGEDQPLMLQLRPQYPPEVDFKEDRGQGAELDVKIPELHLDFYTIVDQRYMRIFTLQVDVSLPLGLHVANNTLDIAIGDLTQAIDPASVKVHNVEMVQASQVETLARNIPTLIGSVSGLLGDDLIPPIEIPDIEGIELQVVGPGTTMIEENGDAAALGVFFRLGFAAEDLSGLRGRLEPAITDAQIDQKDPRELRQAIVAKQAKNQSFGYQDLMPDVRLTMATTGAPSHNVEYAYRINGGPWSFWQEGPELHVDNPILAMEDRFDIEVTARMRGDGRTGAKRNAHIEIINDYTAPTIALDVKNGRVFADIEDNVYPQEDLTMQVRFDEGAWQNAPIGQAIAVQDRIQDGPVRVEVRAEDPSGNQRTVARTFGEKPAPAANHHAATQDTAGCATSTQQSGWLAAIAVFFTLWLRRKRPTTRLQSAASPAYVALSILALLLLALNTSACVDNAKELRGAGAPCVPECGDDQTCVDGVCEDAYVCDTHDDCEHGEICKQGACLPSECSTSDECANLSCEDGTLPFCDYDDYPTVEAGECVCSDGVPMREYGSWLNMLELNDGGVVALAYHNYYGDLILGELQSDDTFEWSFIDGVPEGPIELPPAGRRAGIKAKGDDAGNYVSVVHQDRDGIDVLHAAYQYVSDEDSTTRLRYARATHDNGAWDWTFIDLTDEFVPGLFAEIVLRPGATIEPDDEDDEPITEDGGIAIFFMTADIELDADDDNPAEYYAELSAAYAATQDPETAEDFEITTGIDQSINQVPCGGFCAKRTACVEATNTCAPDASGCDDCDEDNGESCVLIDGSAQCAVTQSANGPAFETIPQGVGLFTSALVDEDGTLHIAYYDQRHGLLKYQQLTIDEDHIVPTDGPMIIDGEVDGVSTGDVGRWTKMLAQDGDIFIFYEDAGRAELRAARVAGSDVEITVLDDGHYQNDDATFVGVSRVGTSIDVTPRESGGFDVYYQDGTNASVRHVIWDDLNSVPDAHPYAVFGSKASVARDVLDYENASNRPKIALASDTGAYGLFTQVLQRDDTTLFASKHISHPTSGIQMDVRAARLRDEGAGSVTEGEGGDGGDTPILECTGPGSYAKLNGTENPCSQCQEHNDGTYWTERYAPTDFYRCVAHHDSSAFNTDDCSSWAFYSDSGCGSDNGVDFRLDDYGTNHLCARANWESDDSKTRDTDNPEYWEKVAEPSTLIVPNWPDDFSSMTPQNGHPNRYRNTIETRRWIFDRAFRYLGQLNGEPGSGDEGGRTYYPGWNAAEVYLEPGQSEWFSFYYNDRKDWQDRIGVLTQFDDDHMEVEVELSFVCGNDGGGGRPRLDGIRYCGAEGFGQNGDKRDDMNVRCGETGDVSTTQRDGGSGDLRTRYSSCIGDTAIPHAELPWSHSENAPKPTIEPSDWGQVRGGIYLEGHLDCGTSPNSNASGRSGWAFVRVTRTDTGEDARHDVCTPIVVRPTWLHHELNQGYDECW